MQKPLIAGNWKMNTTVHEGADLVIKLRELIKSIDSVDVVLAPPFTSIQHISHLVADSSIQLAGQNVFWKEDGAYTGEVSAQMLRATGCSYVIIGHSERRELFGDTDDRVNKKAHAAVRAGLKPIICVGETLEEKEAGRTLSKVKGQIMRALAGLKAGALKELTIAYEPIWAIGTGQSATPETAEEVHNSIRELLYEDYDSSAAKRIRIIYGGSVKPDNIDSLMAMPNIDDALVGGASLKAEDFARIVRFEST